MTPTFTRASTPRDPRAGRGCRGSAHASQPGERSSSARSAGGENDAGEIELGVDVRHRVDELVCAAHARDRADVAGGPLALAPTSARARSRRAAGSWCTTTPRGWWRRSRSRMSSLTATDAVDPRDRGRLRRRAAARAAGRARERGQPVLVADLHGDVLVGVVDDAPARVAARPRRERQELRVVEVVEVRVRARPPRGRPRGGRRTMRSMRLRAASAQRDDRDPLDHAVARVRRDQRDVVARGAQRHALLVQDPVSAARVDGRDVADAPHGCADGLLERSARDPHDAGDAPVKSVVGEPLRSPERSAGLPGSGRKSSAARSANSGSP